MEERLKLLIKVNEDRLNLLTKNYDTYTCCEKTEIELTEEFINDLKELLILNESA